MKRKSRAFGRVLAMALCLALCLAVLPSFAAAETMISSVSVEIAPPRAGEKASYKLTFPDGAPYYNSDYSSNIVRNDICWFNETDAENVYPESTVFEAGKVYRVEIYLTEKDGYVFDYGNMTAKVNGRAAGEAEEWADSLLLSYTFDPVPELINSVSVEIAEPKAGKKPSYELTLPDGAPYFNELYEEGNGDKNSIGWLNKTDSELLDTGRDSFKAGKEYTAVIRLTARDGYAFDPDKMTAKVNGRKAQVEIDTTDDGVMYLAYTFDPLPELIGSVSVEIAEPKEGGRPSYTLTLPDGALYYSDQYNADEYRNDICWYNETNSEYMDPYSTRFEAAKIYTVEIYLTAKDGCVFDTDGMTAVLNGKRVDTDDINHMSDDYIGLSYTFDPLPDTRTKVSSVSVEIAEPKAGEKPSYTLTLPAGASYCSADYDDDEYRNGILWFDRENDEPVDPDSGVFKAGKDYLVEIYLTPKDGYAFDPGKMTAKVNGMDPYELEYDDSVLYMSYIFDPRPKVSTVSVEIAEPKAGEKPSYTLTLPAGAPYFNSDYSGDGYKNGILWYNLTNGEHLDPDSDVFEEGKVYGVDICLAPKDGYIFDPNKVTVKVNGKNAYELDVDDDMLEILFFFDPRPKISTVSVEIAEPKAGEKPSYTATLPSGAHYYSDNLSYKEGRNDIRWYNVTDKKAVDPDSDTFEKGKVYRVEIGLTAKDGYAFDWSNTSGTVNGRKADVDMEYEPFGDHVSLSCIFDPRQEESAYRLGDVNHNGTVDSDDAMLILRYDVRKIGTDRLDLSLADVSGDGRVDSDDAMLVLRFDVKKIAKFPAER